MAEVKLAFYKTPAQAAAMGTTITKTVSLTDAQALVIRDYYAALESGAAISISAMVGVFVAALTKNFKGAMSVTSSVATTIITSTVINTYFGQMADKFDMIRNDSALTFKAVYTYRQHGSNDGAYWLTNIVAKVDY
ncbi:MAG: hypothetical protein PHC92_08635 [Syntrophomonadaceae bacterium]|nr:hypothetical protein [Syntrophomonadaceae bacterium]